MKKLISILFLLPLLASAATVDAVYEFSDYTDTPLNVRRVTITPLGPSADYGGAFLSRRPIVYNAATFYTLTNGYFTATNLVVGYAYQVAFSDGYSEPSVTNYFGTNLSGTVSAITNQTTYINWRAGVATQLFGPYFGTTNVIVNVSSNGTGTGVDAGTTNQWRADIVAQLLRGTNIFVGTNFTGNALNLTNVQGSNIVGTISDSLLPSSITSDISGNAATATMADRLTKHIAAYYVTNYTENRASIHVTGNAASAVNGHYKVSWYNPDTFTGIWTNIASTNLIVMNNPSNSGNIQNQPFVIAASAEPTEFMYQTNQSLLGVRDAWVNDLWADGMTDFAGTATLTWGSNTVRQIVLTSFGVGGTNAGIVATNLLRVSVTGNDEIATRLNGYPFKTLYVAATNATTYDLIYIEPGYHKTKPFHMSNRGFHILGSGADVCIVDVKNFQSGPDPFQSRAIIPWDNCSVGNFTLTNGLIAFAQFSGTTLGGTNAWAHDLAIFPPSQLTYPDNTSLNDSSGDQSQYFNVGVDVSRIGDDNRIERVRIYGGMRGINIQTTYSTSGTINISDCEIYCDSEYVGSPNIWTNAAYMSPGKTNVGGMMPIALSAVSPASQGVYPVTLNISGGKFVSLNGGTNLQAYVGGETQGSRNASLWISRAYTNTVTINLSGIPRFYNGSTNASSYAVLNEATNSNVTIAGYYTSNSVAQVTNYAANFAQLIRQSSYGPSGGVTATAFSGYTSSSAAGNMGANTTDGVITNLTAGYYKLDFSTAALWNANPVHITMFTNGIAASLAISNIEPVSVKIPISVSGIIYLPANTWSDVRYQGDQPEGNSVIYTLSRMP